MKRYIYIIGALATLAFTSCQKEILDTDFNSDPSAVRVNATVGEGIDITRSNPTGDATTQKVFNAGDQISVSADEQMAVTYTRTADGKWNPEANKYLKWNTPSMNFTAYYPVTVGTDAQTFALPNDQSDLAKITAADYMTFSGSKAKTEAHTVDIAMQRKTARVIVHIAGFNDQYTTGYSVSAASVSGNTNGYATGAPKAGAVTVSAYKATDTDFYALLTPTTASGDATFVTLAVTNGTTTDELTVKGIPELETGKSYTYNVTVGKNRITIGSVTVKDWGSEVVIPGGEAKEESSANADTHTVKLTKAGTLTDELLTKAISGETQLIVTGEMNSSDLLRIKTYFKSSAQTVTDIDLSAAKFTNLPVEFLSNNKKITSVKLPEGLTSIYDAAFKECTALTNIVLPASIETLGNTVFKDCQALTGNIDLPNLESIGYECFINSKVLTSILLPKLVTAAQHAFYGCSGLTEINLPYATDLGSGYVFADCTNLREVTLPKLKAVPNYAFSGCTNLEKVNLDVAETLGVMAFKECTALTTIAFPKIVSVGNDAFRDCTNLSSITLPKATTIGISAFFDCTELKTINFPSVTTIGNYALQNCNKITTVKFTTTENFATTSMNDVFWSTATPSKVDLTINKNKETDVTDGNKWAGVTWKTISFSE